MRADRPEDRVFARVLGGGLGVGGVTLGSLFFGVGGSAAGGVIGFGLALWLHRRARRRSDRRRAALLAPFPDAWRELLRERYDHYERLPPTFRRRFEDDLRIFLLETRITGVKTEVTEELRLLVAASAVTLSLGWPDYEWDQLTEVLLYPEEFDRDWRFVGEEGEGDPDSEDALAGQAHPWGTVILSVPSLLESFDDPDDGFHVGLHEFAHLLDVDQTHFDGIPAGLSGERARAWEQVATRERERLLREEADREGPAPRRRRRRPGARKSESAFDPYGAEDAVEFLAVAVEAFFEASLLVREEHPEAYGVLAEYFGQDPAAWDDGRGLSL